MKYVLSILAILVSQSSFSQFNQQANLELICSTASKELITFSAFNETNDITFSLVKDDCPINQCDSLSVFIGAEYYRAYKNAWGQAIYGERFDFIYIDFEGDCEIDFVKNVPGTTKDQTYLMYGIALREIADYIRSKMFKN